MKLIYTILIILISNVVLGQSWTEIYQSKGHTFYYHSTKTVRQYALVNAWIKIEYNPEAAEEFIKGFSGREDLRKTFEGLSYSIHRTTYDCKGQREKTSLVTFYNADGKVLYTIKKESYEQEWQDAIPETVSDAILTKLCEAVQ